MACGVFAETSAIPYKEASPWAVPELDKAAEYGLITDKIKDNINAPITREEFAEIAVRLYEKCAGKSAPFTNTDAFADTNNLEVFKAYNLKIVNGTDTRRKLFLPDNQATREQVAVMLYRTINAINPDADFSAGGDVQFADEREIAGWAVESVKFMYENGFLKGVNGKISPKGTCTREMAVLIAARVYEKYFPGDSGNESEVINGQSNWSQIVVNDMEIFGSEYRISEKNGSVYIFISADKFKYAFKRPNVGYYTYPEVEIIGSSISASWKDEKGNIVMQAEMKENSEMVLINGVNANMGIAPYSENGKLFIPINLFVGALEMDMETSDSGDVLYIQYKNDFPMEILEGTWSDTDADLFRSFEEIAAEAALLPSFATAYQFNNDGTYRMRMVSAGGSNDTFIAQKGKYRIMGSTIAFYDITETIYKGTPFQLIHEDKLLDKWQYSFIGNYNAKEDKIEIGVMWLDRK